jgi:hypothetical protein
MLGPVIYFIIISPVLGIDLRNRDLVGYPQHMGFCHRLARAGKTT